MTKTAQRNPRSAASDATERGEGSVSKAQKYINDVVAGRIVTSKLVRLAIERHQRDLIDGCERGLLFDASKGLHVIVFIETYLKHSIGEHSGRPFILSPWQAGLLFILFGWRHADTGYRRFRFAYVELARGNGKSCLASGIALYELLTEPGAEIFSAATKKEQARIVFAESERMTRQSDALKSRLKIFRDSIFIPGTASRFQPLASEEDSLDGLRPQCIILDELHALGSSGRKLWDVLVSALGKRRSPLLFAITTAGSDRNSVCWQQREYSEKVLSGIFADDTWFSFICGLDEGDNWEDERTWIKANPSLGVTVKLDELRGAINKAKGDPASLNGTLRLRLGVWTQSHTAWMLMDKWDACNVPVDAGTLQGRPCFAGLDLSTTTDISALVLLFPPIDDDKHWSVLPYFFLPEDAIEAREKKDRVPYSTWNRQSLFNLTDGSVIDYDYIRAKINELSKIYNIREIAFDKWNAQQLVTQLEGDGFTMVSFPQGFAGLSAPTKRLMELVLTGELAHGGNPVLRWMASNVMVDIDPAGNIKPSKAKSREKIDGIVSLVMALGRAAVVNTMWNAASAYYEAHDVRFF